MRRPVAIAAVGQTKHAARRLDVSIPEMVREAVDACLDSKGLTFHDIDAVVVGNMELFEGVNQPELWMAAALGAVGKPIYKMNTAERSARVRPYARSTSLGRGSTTSF